MYPIDTDYRTVVRSKKFSSFILDPILKKGVAEKEKNNIFPKIYPGGFACVFKINTNKNCYALRCWTGEQDNLQKRYYEISEYLSTLKLPYFVDFIYTEEGIVVNGGKYPITRMNWVEGSNLRKYIEENISSPLVLSKLANSFCEMVKDLHENNISHGDLQSENIIIEKNGNIRLIDYDSIYVPKLSKERDTIKGIPSFQHPTRNNVQKLTPKADYFSELVIYLSILVFSIRPSYWDKVKDYEKELVFRESDFTDYKNAIIFDELKKLSSPIISAYTDVLYNYCQANSIDNFQPLEEIIKEVENNKSKNQNNNKTEVEVDLWKDIVVQKEKKEVIKDVDEGFDWGSIGKSKPPIKESEVNKEDIQNKNKWGKISNSQSKNIEYDKEIADNDSKTPNSIWSKLEEKDVNNKDVWGRLYKLPDEKSEDVVVDNIDEENANLWAKMKNTVTNIWSRLMNMFNS